MFKKILVPLTKTPFPRRIEGIQAEGVTAIEVEEVLVGFWEAAQNEEYEVVEDVTVDAVPSSSVDVGTARSDTEVYLALSPVSPCESIIHSQL